jgi:DNA-binding IclR family transcriptional regulator
MTVRDHVQSTDTLFRILEILRERDGTGVTALSEELGLAKSSVHAHLSTLKANRYVVQNGSTYYVANRFLQLSEYARTRREDYELAADLVTKLSEETGERAQFIVEEHGKGIYLYCEGGEHAVHTESGVGREVFLHSTAAGKAILAELPDQRVDEILDSWGLPDRTDQTITDADALHEELAAITDHGYSKNREENIDALNAVGVAVTRPDGSVSGAFSVSAPAHRLQGDRLDGELPELLLGVANELELNIAYS